MKKIKTLIVASVTGLLALAAPILISTFTVTAPVAITGCVTGPLTNSQAVIDATAMILQNSARAGALAAITPPTGKTNNAVYFNLASEALGTFLTGKDYTPGALQNTLLQINSPYLNDVWVQLGIGAVLDLYQVYYGQYVQGQVNGNAYAGQFLLAIQNGFNQALGKPVAQLKGTKPFTGSILPRPLKK